MVENINIYTDGSSLGNPGPGGYGIILEWKKKNYTKEYSKGFVYTTNNRMELLAVIVALEKLKMSCPTLFALGWFKVNFDFLVTPCDCDSTISFNWGIINVIALE